MAACATAGPFTLSIWTSLYWDLSPEDALRHIADLGWGAVDLSCEHFGELWRAEDRVREAQWRELAESLGILPWQCHLPMDLNLASTDIDERAAMVQCCAELLQLAGRLGVRNAVLHTGWIRKGEVGPTRQVRQLMKDSYRRLMPVCAETAVRLAHENLTTPWFGTDPAAIGRLAEELDPEWLGICYDSSHANVAGIPAGEGIRACRGHLLCLHLSDNDGSGDQHRLPFEGSVDWRALMAALAESGYGGPVNFELPALSGRPLPVRDAALPYVQRVMSYAATGGDCCYRHRTEPMREYMRQGWIDPKFGYE
jgi:sugar phosphate isomerase/epimerase